MDMESILIANPGSTSRKYALYDELGEVARAAFHMKGDDLHYSFSSNGREDSGKRQRTPLTSSIGHFLELVKRHLQQDVRPHAIALRVVASGTRFQHHAWMDEPVKQALEKQVHLMPLHVRATLDELTLLQQTFPEVDVLGVSDSAFHRTQAPSSRCYGIDPVMAEQSGIQRYGYHGLAASSAVSILSKHLTLKKKVVLCHLGGGTSIMALEQGKSIYTSMGFSPLEGPMMVTRSGSLDVTAAVQLLDGTYTRRKLLDVLYNQSGIKGWTGTSDMKEVLHRCSIGDRGALSAIDKYVSDVLDHIGRAVMKLRGLEVIAFSGGVGAHATRVRDRILDGLHFLGYKPGDTVTALDKQLHMLNHPDSAIQGFALNVDEEKEMANILRSFR